MKDFIFPGCHWIQRRNIGVVNLSPYLFMLNQIRAEENTDEKVTPILQLVNELDIYYLVDAIWKSRSVVSENNDLHLLRLVRFRANEPWAPWNCVLLTQTEADLHSASKNYESLYSPYVFRKILIANDTARCAFKYSFICNWKTFIFSSQSKLFENKFLI